MYSKKTEEHFLNPYKEGKLKVATGKGTEGDDQIGESITIWIQTKEDVIQDISFEANGSCLLTAVGSAIITLADKKKEQEAFCITIQEINQELGEVPWEKIESIELGKRALQKAIIEDYQKQGKSLQELCKEDSCKIKRRKE